MSREQTLPRFDLATTGDGHLSSDDLLGRHTVLYFYPKDDTPGCTVEGSEFTVLHPQFQEHQVSVFGVSPDSTRSHEKFIAKCSLGIGRTYTGVERSTFLIGPEGTVVQEWRHVRAPGHAAEVLEAVAGRA